MNFSPEPLPVFAAGSLREATTDVARDYETRTGQKIALPFSIRNAWPMRVLGARPHRPPVRSMASVRPEGACGYLV